MMIRQVCETAVQPLHRARCHRGAAVLEPALSDGIHHPADATP